MREKCSGPHLQERTRDSPLSWSTLLAGLQRRVGLLDAVVFCGGEATMDPALGGAIQQVRALGFKVGLETACIYPELQKVLPMWDWVGFDVKAPFDRYAEITGVAGRRARVCRRSSPAASTTNAAPRCIRRSCHRRC
ncbi:hypothetical protein SAMN05428959_10316 [Duganella sp. CF517]|uniref:hypothetical protein n=1 Tax=Duganella sp. CF517 TaxID=1881038 RepID=UPI0008B93023|nr:hypothetical protein [Duganella sp. CF517]SEN76543.1 hypothetical protein SAMN05428959_10316 [Duganella sp. CF517]